MEALLKELACLKDQPLRQPHDADVGGGRALDHFAGQRSGWSAVSDGGRPAEKWRPDRGD